MNIPTASLHNGKEIPAVGFGCAFGNWTGGDVMQGFLPEEAWRSVTLALDTGFRHFDTGHCYGTERHVGDVLGRAMAEGIVERRDLFVTTKVAHPATPPHVAISHRLTWNSREVEDIAQRVRDDFDASKEKLGMGYVDMLPKSANAMGFLFRPLRWPGLAPLADRAYDYWARRRFDGLYCESTCVRPD